MISFDDCIGLCGLNAQDVSAIAEHEHVPEIAAATMARYLMCHKGGAESIRQIFIDDIRAASQTGNHRHAAELVSGLREFLSLHPTASREKM
jgi:hypothetical protein